MTSPLGFALLFATCINPWFSLPSAQVKDAGIYRADFEVVGNWADEGPIGIGTYQNVKLVEATTKVPCKPGVIFGVRALLTNPYPDHTLYVSCKFTHPPFTTPDGHVRTEENDVSEAVRPGDSITKEFLWFYIKECPYEFVPGKWTITLSADGSDLLTKDFEVYRPGAGPIAAGDAPGGK